MTSFDELLLKAKTAKEADPNTALAEVLLGGELVTFRFSELDGDAWSEIAIRNPPRLDVEIDRKRGYNVHTASQAAAVVSGVRLVDGEGVALTAEQWTALWPLLSGHEFTTICDTVWSLNVWQPSERLEQAKKDSRATRASAKK